MMCKVPVKMSSRNQCRLSRQSSLKTVCLERYRREIVEKKRIDTYTYLRKVHAAKITISVNDRASVC